MITVALYLKTTKINPDGKEIYFLSPIGEMEIETKVPSVQYDMNGVLATFEFNEPFSKQVGHFAYVKNKDKAKLTPFGDDHSKSTGADTNSDNTSDGSSPSSDTKL